MLCTDMVEHVQNILMPIRSRSKNNNTGEPFPCCGGVVSGGGYAPPQ